MIRNVIINKISDIFNLEKLTIKKHNAFLMIYILLSFLVYLGVSDYLIQQGNVESMQQLFKNLSYENNIGLNLWADSTTYTAASKEYDLKDIGLLYDIHPNFLGPFLVLKIFNSNELLIYLFNVILFLSSVLVLIKYYPVNKYKFVLLLCISPMLLSSLLAINKEIFAMYSMSMFLIYRKNRKPIFLFACLLSAYISRLEMVFVMIVLLLSFSKYNYFRNKRLIMIAVYLVSVSVIFPFMLDNAYYAHNYERTLEAIDMYETYEAKGTGIFALFLKLQENFCYFLAFIPKTLHALIGAAFRVNIYNIINKVDFYHAFITVSQSFVYLFLLIQMIMKKKINIDNEIFYIAIIFCIFINLSLVITTRYLFPLHLLFVLLLSTRNLQKHTMHQINTPLLGQL